jgi:hypothetical protein
MTSRTAFLAKLIGLYCVLYALSMFIRGPATVEAVTAMLQDPAMMLALGVILLAAGLAMVLAHNIWSGGALPVMVTVVGWLTTMKAMLLLLLPAGREAVLYLNWLHYRQLFYLYAAITLVLGLWFTYRGFASKAGWHI